MLSQLTRPIFKTRGATGDFWCEIGNLGLQMAPEDGAFGTGGSSRMALGGGA